jgi:two-component system NtrC family sensor kinase
MKQAAQQGMSVLSQDKVSAKATAPIKVRDQVIGVLDAHKSTNEPWTDEEVSLLETLTEQLGVALESARLYQDSQRRAAREQLASQITSRMRETLDLETVLSTAAQEIGTALGLMALDVRLSTAEELK